MALFLLLGPPGLPVGPPVDRARGSCSPPCSCSWPGRCRARGAAVVPARAGASRFVSWAGPARRRADRAGDLPAHRRLPRRASSCSTSCSSWCSSRWRSRAPRSAPSPAASGSRRRLPATATVTGLDHVDADVVELTLEASAAVVGHSLARCPPRPGSGCRWSCATAGPSSPTATPAGGRRRPRGGGRARRPTRKQPCRPGSAERNRRRERSPTGLGDGLGPLEAGDVGPQALEVVELAGVLLEDVDDDVAVVHEHPLAGVEALDALRASGRPTA